MKSEITCYSKYIHNFISYEYEKISTPRQITKDEVGPIIRSYGEFLWGSFLSLYQSLVYTALVI